MALPHWLFLRSTVGRGVRIKGKSHQPFPQPVLDGHKGLMHSTPRNKLASTSSGELPIRVLGTGRNYRPRSTILRDLQPFVHLCYNLICENYLMYLGSTRACWKYPHKSLKNIKPNTDWGSQNNLKIKPGSWQKSSHWSWPNLWYRSKRPTKPKWRQTSLPWKSRLTALETNNGSNNLSGAYLMPRTLWVLWSYIFAIMNTHTHTHT